MTDNTDLFRDIKPFRWEELAGKTLEIGVGKDSGYVSVVGKDVDTGIIYVLHHSNGKGTSK